MPGNPKTQNVKVNLRIYTYTELKLATYYPASRAIINQAQGYEMAVVKP